jgi:KipI family sensor histidine kinase inhibitor
MLDRVRHFLFAFPREHGILNLHPGYATVLVSFDPRRIAHDRVEQLARMADGATSPLPEAKTVSIPVCYGGELGPDLDEVATHCSLTPERVVELHSTAEYLVYFLGFSPGFAYLGGMPPQLATPRLPSPRVRVPAGSVGIAGEQTGVYPIASPGGWRLIGRTGLRLFSPVQDPPALLAPGDRVRFVPVSRADFDQHPDHG